MLEVIILAVIQGVTEFLPISSSAHLVLPSQLLGWQDQGLVFDVAVHLGSLFAIVMYFRQDIFQLSSAWLQHIVYQKQSTESHLAWCIALATVPGVVFGYFLNDHMDQLRSLLVIASTTLVFGVLLGIADCCGKKNTKTDIQYWQALFIGMMQALALIPGTSRSGITMTAALLLGFSRVTSAKFSFYLSIPLITAASCLQLKELVSTDEVVDWSVLLLAVIASFISAYACIHYFLKLIERLGFMPFVIYRLVLAAVLFLIYFQS